MPVARKSSASSRGSDSRLPSRSAAANGARAGEMCVSRTATPRSRSSSTNRATWSQPDARITRTQRADATRTIERQRCARARIRKSNSPGFSAAAGRRPRPSTRIRSPTRTRGGSPSTITAARPETVRHRLPARNESTRTTHSLEGPIAAARRGSPVGTGSRRKDSSTVPMTATGAGESARYQPRSSRRKRSNCASDQAAPQQQIAPASGQAAARGPRHLASHSQIPRAATAAIHQAPARLDPSTGSTRRPTTQPAARHAAATTTGRGGSGSVRRAAHSQATRISGPAASRRPARPPHSTATAEQSPRTSTAAESRHGKPIMPSPVPETLIPAHACHSFS